MVRQTFRRAAFPKSTASSFEGSRWIVELLSFMHFRSIYPERRRESYCRSTNHVVATFFKKTTANLEAYCRSQP